MERRLGRGLGTLLGDSTSVADPEAPRELAVHLIRANPQQPRKHFEEDSLRDLAVSLKQHGFLQPIVVRPVGSEFEIIAGERRWRAAKLAGIEMIPALVRRDVTEAQLLELALVENVQREDLDAIERAQGYRAMQVALDLTQEEVARKVGLQRATVANHLRLLELPQEVQVALAKGLISMGHARALLALASKEQQTETLARIVREGLSVRQVESIPRLQRSSRPDQASPPPRKTWIAELEARLRERLGTKVAVRNSRGYRGQIVIDYFDRSSLERICEAIAPSSRVE